MRLRRRREKPKGMNLSFSKCVCVFVYFIVKGRMPKDDDILDNLYLRRRKRY